MHNKKRGASASPTSNSQPFKSRGIPTVQYLEPCVSRLPPVSFYRVSRLFCVSGPVRACVLSVVEIWVSRLPPVSFYPAPPGVFYRVPVHVVGRGERSTPGLRLFLRLLSRSRFSCGFVSLGLGGWL